MNPNVEPQLEMLRGWMRQWKSALIAYSGGVDSALVMAVAHEVLGDKALGCIGVSPSYPQREQRDAIALAKHLGAPCRAIDTEEHLDPNYAANPANRCYFCKTDLYDRLRQVAGDEQWDVILDGNNASDLGDDRPGRTAAHEHGVRSPLVELGITKEQVRELARRLNLPVWDKPSMACLSSRVPQGTTITPELLHQVERAEDALAALGFRQFRVRHHGEIARIELQPADLARALQQRNALVEDIRRAGYRYVCLDLAGFRSGGPQPIAVTVNNSAGVST